MSTRCIIPTRLLPKRAVTQTLPWLSMASRIQDLQRWPNERMCVGHQGLPAFS